MALSTQCARWVLPGRDSFKCTVVGESGAIAGQETDDINTVNRGERRQMHCSSAVAGLSAARPRAIRLVIRNRRANAWTSDAAVAKRLRRGATYRSAGGIGCGRNEFAEASGGQTAVRRTGR